MAVWIADALLIVVLLIAVWTDLTRGKIYNWLTLPSALAGMVLWTAAGAAVGGMWGAGAGLGYSLLGLMLLFVPMFVAFALGGIGGGDAKLAGAIGAIAGWKLGIHVMFYGFIATAIVALAVMIGQRVVRQTAGRVWRFLWLLTLGARPAAPDDRRSPRVATALPWAIGAIWAVVEQHWLDGRTVFDRLAGG